MRRQTIPEYRVSIDAGNFAVKVVTNAYGGTTDSRLMFRHALASITRNDYDRALGTARGNDAGVVMVGGRPYAVGEAALRHAHTTRKGAARYTRDYLGVLAAAALYRLLPVAECRVTLVASHAPRDFDQRHRLQDALIGRWVVDGAEGQRVYTVDKVDTLDESIGSIFHHLLNPNLTERRDTPMRDGSTLIVDVGGFTTDLAPIDQTATGPQIDASAMMSVTVGTGHLHSALERYLRATYTDLFFSQAAGLAFDRLEAALHSGVYKAGNQKLNVTDFVQQELNLVVSQIEDTINGPMGGLLNYDNVMFTGGGGALTLPHLQARFNRVNLFLADRDVTSLPYANASGALRLMRLVSQGVK